MALEQSQQQSKNTVTEFTCVYCKQTAYKSGFFTITKDGILLLFCSKKCADYEKNRKQALICAYCGKSFENLSTGYKRKYCSNICNVNGHYSKYKKFNWCDMCNEWISKDDSIFKPKGSIISYVKNKKYAIKKDNYFCPICKNRLRVRNWYNNKKDKNGSETTISPPPTNKTETL